MNKSIKNQFKVFLFVAITTLITALISLFTKGDILPIVLEYGFAQWVAVAMWEAIREN